jgi:hypothetical protein
MAVALQVQRITARGGHRSPAHSAVIVRRRLSIQAQHRRHTSNLLQLVSLHVRSDHQNGVTDTLEAVRAQETHREATAAPEPERAVTGEPRRGGGRSQVQQRCRIPSTERPGRRERAYAPPRVPSHPPSPAESPCCRVLLGPVLPPLPRPAVSRHPTIHCHAPPRVSGNSASPRSCFRWGRPDLRRALAAPSTIVIAKPRRQFLISWQSLSGCFRGKNAADIAFCSCVLLMIHKELMIQSTHPRGD